MANQGNEIEYVSLSKERLQDALEAVRTSFFLHENVCQAVGLPKSREAQMELEELCVNTARDGVSIVAVDKVSNKMVGVAFNKIQRSNVSAEDASYFENYKAQCKQPEAKGVLQFMIDVDASCDLFKLCDIDCLIEIMFLGTLVEYRGRGIATELCKATAELGKRLLEGKNVKVSIDENALDLEPVPKVVSMIGTSFKTQKIARTLGYAVAHSIPYSEFTYEGSPYVVEKETPATELVYKFL